MKKIDSNGYSVFISGLTKSSFLGAGLFYLFLIGRTTSLFCVFIGFILSLLYLFFIIKFINIYPELEFNEKLNKIFGRVIGKSINFLFLILFSLSACIIVFSLLAFISSQYLINTPKVYICGLIWLLIIYIAIKDIEVLSRFSSIAFVICFLLFLMNFISLFNTISIDNYLPMFTIGIKDIIKTSLVFSVLFCGPCITLCSIKKSTIVDSKKLTKHILIRYILSFIVLFIIIATIIGSMGINTSILFSYPAFIVLSKINIFDFIDSVENIAVILWFFYLIVSGALIIMNNKDNIINTLNIKNKKMKTGIGIILGLLSFAIPSFILDERFASESLSLNYINFPIIIFSSLIILIFISVSIYFIKKFMRGNA